MNNCHGLWTDNSDRTEWSSIRSDIIRVITNRTTVQWECDLFVASMITDRIEPNEAPINHKNYNFREKKNHSQVVEERKKICKKGNFGC